MTTVVWSPGALANVRAIKAYVTQENPRAAQALARRLIDAGEGLVLFPNRRRPVPGSVYRELLTVDPYIIRYRVKGEQVSILRIRHAARRPTKP